MNGFPPSDKTAVGLWNDIVQRVSFLERRLHGPMAQVITDLLTAGKVRITGTGDVTLTSTDHPFQIGPDTGVNMAIDANEIMSRNNGAVNDLNLNVEGGNVNIGDATSRISIPALRQFWHVGHGAAQSIPNAQFTRITSWTTVYQVGAMTYSSGVFTVPVDGLYQVHAQYRTVAQTTSVGQRTCRLVFTGTSAGNVEGMGNQAAANLSGGSEITQLRRMVAGDTVAFEVYQSHGAAINTIAGEQYTNFAIQLVTRL